MSSERLSEMLSSFEIQLANTYWIISLKSTCQISPTFGTPVLKYSRTVMRLLDVKISWNELEQKGSRLRMYQRACSQVSCAVMNHLRRSAASASVLRRESFNQT